MFKGITFKYRYPNCTEGAGSIFQSVYLAFVMSRLFDYQFYFYPNHHVTYDTNSTDQKLHWLQLFNFIIVNSIPLDITDSSIVVEHNSITEYFDLNKPSIINADFNLSRSILEDHYERYCSDIHLELVTSFHEKNLFAPLNARTSAENFNITIHIQQLRSLFNTPQKGVWTEDSILAKVNDKSIQAWQYFDVDYNDSNQNHLFYTNLYANLILKLIGMVHNQTKKNVCVNLVTFGNTRYLDDFIKAVSPHAELNLLTDIETPEAFYYFTKADILVQAQSSLSWLASFFCRGSSFVRFPFRHQPSPNSWYFNDELQFFKFRHNSVQ